MVSIGLAIPSTRFPSVEPTWEFTPRSHEPGAMCTWEAGESGRGAIASASHQPRLLGEHDFAEGVSKANTPAVLQPEAHVHEPLLG
jgi:hypothetical protein